MIEILSCRSEQGESMKLSQAQLLAQLEKRATVDETEIKRKIMDNYGFVDMEHDSKYHRPMVSKKNVSLNKKVKEGSVSKTTGQLNQVTKLHAKNL